MKIDEEMRPLECPQTDTHTHTHTRTDAKRFYYLSHAICYSYGADKKIIGLYITDITQKDDGLVSRLLVLFCLFICSFMYTATVFGE